MLLWLPLTLRGTTTFTQGYHNKTGIPTKKGATGTTKRSQPGANGQDVRHFALLLVHRQLLPLCRHATRRWDSRCGRRTADLEVRRLRKQVALSVSTHCGWTKKPWHDDSPVHTNNQCFPMFFRWRRIFSILSRTGNDGHIVMSLAYLPNGRISKQRLLSLPQSTCGEASNEGPQIYGLYT